MAETEKCEVVRSVSADTGLISASRRDVMKGLAVTAIAGFGPVDETRETWTR